MRALFSRCEPNSLDAAFAAMEDQSGAIKQRQNDFPADVQSRKIIAARTASGKNASNAIKINPTSASKVLTFQLENSIRQIATETEYQLQVTV